MREESPGNNKNYVCPHCAERDTQEISAEEVPAGFSPERIKVRDSEEFKDLVRRLNRIEGQIRGIKGMVENSAYCIDILTQVSAAQAALNSFSKELLASHISSCVAEDIRAGNEEKLSELIKFLPKMMR